MANPQAGSRNLVEYAEKEPATGNITAISPSAWTVMNIIMPIRMYAIRIEAGPPVARARPVPINRPVPILPPMAIICRCRPFNLLTNGLAAVAAAAASASNDFLRPPILPRVTEACGSRRKESTTLADKGLFKSSMLPSKVELPEYGVNETFGCDPEIECL